MKKRVNQILAVLILLIGSGLIFILKDSGSQLVVPTVSPKISTISKKRFITGKIIPDKEIEIKSSLSGILDKLYVEVGDQVDKGDKIASIKLVSDPARIENAINNLNKAKIDYANTEITLNRNKELFSQGVIPLVELEEYERNHLISKEEYNSAQTQLELLITGNKEQGKGITNLMTSTTKGTVLEIPLQEGASVIERNNFSEGTTLATIADLTSLLFIGEIGESDIQFMNEGMLLNLTVPALNNHQMRAQLERVFPKGVETNGVTKFRFEAKVSLHTDSVFIRSGFTAVAEILLQERADVITIEEKYLQFENDSTFVLVIQENDNKPTKKWVITGLSDGLNVEVISGLSIDDRIVVAE